MFEEGWRFGGKPKRCLPGVINFVSFLHEHDS